MARIWILSALGIVFLAAESVKAQGPTWRPGPANSSGFSGAQSSPAVSPYMNLLRRGSSAAVNYYGLVRPAIEFQGAIQNLQQQVNEMPAPGTGLGTNEGVNTLLTGSRARFLNTGNYFLSGVPTGTGRGGSGGGGSGSVVIVNQQGVGGGGAQSARMGGAVSTVTPPKR